MQKDTSKTTPTSSVATTDAPPADYVEFGLLIEKGVPKGKAASQIWPALKASNAKAQKVSADPRFKAWQVTRREMNDQRVRQITAALGVDYESRIIALASAFNDPDVKTRERLQIHDKLTTAEGRKAAKTKDPSSGNSLEKILQGIGAGAVGAALGAGARNGRLPDVRGAFPEDTEQDGLPCSDGALAAPDTVLEGQAEA